MLLAACALLLQSDRLSVGADTAGWLEKLRAPAAEERASAQRWLARHLTGGDLGALREAARSGDAESRRRIALALADDDAHLALAVSLGTDAEPLVAEVGREALAERLARWCPAWTRRGIDRAAVLRSLRDESDRVVAIEARTADRRLDVALDQLARFGPGLPPLVLDPDLALSEHPRDAPADAAGVLQGTSERVLDELVRLHRAEFEGFAITGDPDTEGGEVVEPPPEGPIRPWIRVRRSVAVDERSAVERIVEWCLEVAGTGDPTRRSACARAVAATGWPGGIAWLEERAFAGGDAAALEGLLLAAGHGQVAPSLGRAEVVERLLATFPRDLQAGDSFRADVVVRALAAAGPVGEKGEDLAAIVAGGLANLPPREQWLRLVALEGMRAPSAAAATAIEALLSVPSISPPLRFQALRARAATGRDPAVSTPLGDPEGLLAWADGAGEAEACVRLLVTLRIPAPPLRPDPKADSRLSPSLRAAELEWLYSTRDASTVAPLLARLCAPPAKGGIGLEALTERTRAWVRRAGRPRFDAAVRAARGLPAADVDRIDRLEILSGTASEELQARWTGRLAKADANAATREDLLCLGAMATREEARAALILAIASPARLDDLASALELAVGILRAARREEDERAFVKVVADAAREGPQEVRSRFRSDAWPPRVSAEPIRAGDRDRSLDRSGL